jgi:hypothetical protein
MPPATVALTFGEPLTNLPMACEFLSRKDPCYRRVCLVTEHAGPRP